MIGIIRKLRTLHALGWFNVASVLVYRWKIKLHIHPVQFLKNNFEEKDLFISPKMLKIENSDFSDTPVYYKLFGWKKIRLDPLTINWLINHINPDQHQSSTKKWWYIPDFNQMDIKCVWELSRFSWMPPLALKAKEKNSSLIPLLNKLIMHWQVSNPPYYGPNWKCGQEASLRVINVIISSYLLNQHLKPEDSLKKFIAVHLERIHATYGYAKAQKNNHATSEAAALFIGGAFLLGHHKFAKKWLAFGRKQLESGSQRLFENDGSFSQYSVNYHRLVLDTYSVAEIWRRILGLSCFSRELEYKLKKATKWLASFADLVSGDAPNIGANDGACLFDFGLADFRDFRPSIQLAAAIFLDRDVFGSGPWNKLLDIFLIQKPQSRFKPTSITFAEGGYHVLRRGQALAVLKFPNFNYRPSQADHLHLDLWYDGVNILRDTGTFSYNAAGAEYFASTAAHNTIEFDGRDQMPKISRFLYADWTKSDEVVCVNPIGDYAEASASYTDSFGAKHSRRVALSARDVTCFDEVCGSFEFATLRWHLPSDQYYIQAGKIHFSSFVMTVVLNGQIEQPKISIVQESRYYQKKSEILELSISFSGKAIVKTRLGFYA